MPQIANTVVADLSRDGKACFTVDGEPFPWWVSDEGPSARKLKDDLYLVHVTILVVSAGGDTLPETFYHEGLRNGWAYPVIQGVEFPWLIGRDGFTYRSAGSRAVPSVELEFFAEHVDGVKVTDMEAPEDGRIFDANGYVRRVVEAA